MAKINREMESIVLSIQDARNVDREVVLLAIEAALEQAVKQDRGSVRVAIDRETFEIKAHMVRTVVVPPAVTRSQIGLSDAREIDPEIELGAEVETPTDPPQISHIGVQAAKNTILQRLSQAEKEHIYQEYKDSVGKIITGVVRRFKGNNVVVQLDHGEAIITSKGRIQNENYDMGARIRAYVVSVSKTAHGPEIILSRSHPDFVRRLFELEVSEIGDGVLEIKGIAREAGFRSKVAVLCHDERVDPVGACVGVRGTRVKNIVRELSGEKIDIVRWSDDIKTLIGNSLAPAKLSKIEIDEDIRSATIMVPPDQLSLAIGKRGQNARLTSKLTGWRIDIRKKESQEVVDFEAQIKKAVELLAGIEGVGMEKAHILVSAGFLSPEGILAAEVEDLAQIEELNEESAQDVWEAVDNYCSESNY